MDAVVHPGAYLLPDCIELISADGKLHAAAYDVVKALCFISEPGHADLFGEHKLFERRPKVPGLWTRFTFRDADKLDGILPHNMLEWPKEGYLITPPRANANRQRVFIPRAALLATELRGVVGTSAPGASRRRKAEPSEPDGEQLRMFDS
jgi:hypothetical protein